MPKEEWGTKRVCPTTGKRFYDLNREPIVSPYTGEVVVLDGSKTGRMMVADKPDKDATKQKQTGDSDGAVLEEDDSREDVSLEEEQDVLEEDEDNVSLDDIADVADEKGDES